MMPRAMKVGPIMRTALGIALVVGGIVLESSHAGDPQSALTIIPVQRPVAHSRTNPSTASAARSLPSRRSSL